MLIIKCDQGTPEWHQARLGIPTASEFDKICTAGGKPSTQADKYANRLIAEMMLGAPVEDWKGNAWGERGHEKEPQARAHYAYKHNCEPVQVGFVTDDARTMGCSPDSLIGEDGLLEIKCPSPQVHIEYLLKDKIDSGYYAQVQGQLLVTGRQWCDLISYYPGLPDKEMRFQRDLKYLETMMRQLREFRQLLEQKKARMIALGHMAG